MFALSSLVSADIGLEIVKAGDRSTDFRIELVAFLALSLLVLFAPLLAFSGKLLAARDRGLIEYGAAGRRVHPRVRREMDWPTSG